MSVPSVLPRRGPSGFTLVELAVVLAIAAILAGLAVPRLSRAIATQALAAQSAEFMAALRFARAQALLQGVAVTVCAAATPPVPPACQAAGAADWRHGWVVFSDPQRLGVPAQGHALQVRQALAHSGGVAGTRASISFTAAGFATDAASHYLFNPPAAGADAPPATLVCVSKQGRPRLASAGACS